LRAGASSGQLSGAKRLLGGGALSPAGATPAAADADAAMASEAGPSDAGEAGPSDAGEAERPSKAERASARKRRRSGVMPFKLTPSGLKPVRPRSAPGAVAELTLEPLCDPAPRAAPAPAR
jgi:hypothetical protein